MTVIGSTAYVAVHSSGLQAIDVSDPLNPTIIGSVDTPGFARGVAIIGNSAFVADGNRGLSIVPAPAEITPLSIAGDREINTTFPSPAIEGHYTIRVFNNTQFHELPGAVTFSNEMAKHRQNYGLAIL